MFTTPILSLDEYPPDRWITSKPLVYEVVGTAIDFVPKEVRDASNDPCTHGWLELITKDGVIIGYRLTVPELTITDLASIPRLLRGLFNVNGMSRKGAVLHDFLYRQGAFSRALCDSIFKAAMQSSDVNPFVTFSLYRGVRIGGWVAYNNYRKEYIKRCQIK